MQSVPKKEIIRLLKCRNLSFRWEEKPSQHETS